MNHVPDSCEEHRMLIPLMICEVCKSEKPLTLKVSMITGEIAFIFKTERIDVVLLVVTYFQCKFQQSLLRIEIRALSSGKKFSSIIGLKN